MSECVVVDRKKAGDEGESIGRVSNLDGSDGNARSRVESERAEARSSFDKVSLLSDSRSLRGSG